jgi:hypothetical protein
MTHFLYETGSKMFVIAISVITVERYGRVDIVSKPKVNLISVK